MSDDGERTYDPPIDLQSPTDPNLMGTWLAVIDGTSLSDLNPIEPRFVHEITLRADGTADHHWLAPEVSFEYSSPPPFPITWETTSSGMLRIIIPIAPMPEYEMPDWTTDAMNFDVLALTPETLTLSDRPYDGEIITTYRRVNLKRDDPPGAAGRLRDELR